MVVDRLAEAGRLAELYAAHHGGAEQLVRIILFQLVKHLRGQIEPAVIHSDDNAGYGKIPVVKLFYLFYLPPNSITIRSTIYNF